MTRYLFILAILLSAWQDLLPQIPEYLDSMDCKVLNNESYGDHKCAGAFDTQATYDLFAWKRIVPSKGESAAVSFREFAVDKLK